MEKLSKCSPEIRAISGLLGVSVACEGEKVKVTDDSQFDREIFEKFAFDEKYFCSRPNSLEGWITTLADDLKNDRLTRI